MLLLTSTSDKLQVVTSSTADTHVQASYVDYSSGAITPDRLNKIITTATTTDVVAAPAANTQRNVKHLSIRNKHASTSQDVTVKHTDGTTAVELFKCTLAPGEHLVFNDGTGFQVLDSAGALKKVATFENTPWTAYTPTISSTTGTITSTGTVTGAYKQVGKTLFISVVFAITNIGTAGGDIRFTLPTGFTTAARKQNLSGTETGVTGYMLRSVIDASTAVVRLWKYDFTFLGGNGYEYTVGGVLEVA